MRGVGVGESALIRTVEGYWVSLNDPNASRVCDSSVVNTTLDNFLLRYSSECLPFAKVHAAIVDLLDSSTNFLERPLYEALNSGAIGNHLDGHVRELILETRTCTIDWNIVGRVLDRLRRLSRVFAV